jgi:glycerophosphoryl diester phosphodiesterase
MMLVAHRGYWERYPENTLVSIEAALHAGARMVEFDVQLCADQTPVLLHDGNLQRTAGIDASVFELDAAALGVISVHEPQRLDDRFKPAPVPTLLQALALFERYPEATALVEIKQESIEHFGLERTLDVLLETIRPYDGRCVIIAYNADALVYARAHGHGRIGWVLDAFDDAHRLRAYELQPDYLICNHKKLAGQTLWEGGWHWILYDITDAETALSLAARGAALIETRDIGGLLRHPALCEHGRGHE